MHKEPSRFQAENESYSVVRVWAGLGNDSRESWLVPGLYSRTTAQAKHRDERAPRPPGATQLKLATYVGVVPPSESGPFERALSTGIQLMVLHMVVLEFMW